MTNTAIGNSDWILTGLNSSRAATPCDHCDRDVKRGFVIQGPGGREMRVGRGCVKKLTGWTIEWAEAQRMLKAAVYTERREIVRAEFPTLNDAQVGSVAFHDYNWTRNLWRTMANNYARTR